MNSCSFKVAAVWRVVKLCRFNLVLPILVGFFLIVVPNGQEVLRRMVFESSGYLVLWFFLSLIVWALSVWYWARVILSFQFPDWPPSPTAEERNDPKAREVFERRRMWILTWHLWMPRICGVLALVVVLSAVALASYEPRVMLGGRGRLFWITLLVTALFWLFVWQRRKAAGWIKQKCSPRAAAGTPRQESPLRPLSFKYEGRTAEVVFYDRLMELPRITKFLLALSLGVLFFGMLWLFLDPGRTLVWAPRLGSATILLLAASGWTCVGALVMYWANHYRVPVFLLAVAWLTFISPYNNEHKVRTISAGPFERKAPDKQLRAWLTEREEVMGRQRDEKQHPVVIVAAEGGGIVGAYWTASVLAGLEKAYPGFSSHVFAISGVSGGSLGGAVFNALLAEEQQHRGRYCVAQTDILTCAQAMLRHDFVAPLFAAMLYPDLVQRFLPFQPDPGRWDRGVALEMAWERAWDEIADHTGKNPFTMSFEQLWDGERRWRLPGLVLQSTLVEQGKRVLLSNFSVRQEVPSCQEAIEATSRLPFHDVLDFSEALKCLGDSAKGPLQVRLSTAVHNSARFSFVSPAGKVSRNFHVVDGGYFENSGATTAAELVQVIEAYKEEALVPIVIYISNSPQGYESLGISGQPGLGLVGESVKKAKRLYFSEMLMPIQAIINARSGRGSFAVNWLQLHLDPGENRPTRFFTFRLMSDGVEFPLGWTLSKDTWDEMDRQQEKAFSHPKCKPAADAALSIDKFLLDCRPDKYSAEARPDLPPMR